jgi:hypothetical protein
MVDLVPDAHWQPAADPGEQGPTSAKECILPGNYHHDICIHRRGWQIELHPTPAPPGQARPSQAKPASMTLARARSGR